MPARSLDVQVQEDKIQILSTIDLFRHLSPDALNMLAIQMKTVHFQPLDKVVSMGSEGDAMYVIIEGFLDVYVHNQAENKDFRVSTLSAGQFFGEIGLLTGKPRTATVIAATEVVAYEITRDCIMPLVNTYPDVLETMSRVMAERQMREQYFFENMHKKEVTQETQRLSDEILASILSFFGLMKETVTHRRKDV
jgi:CRP-like cAMP-binding protein